MVIVYQPADLMKNRLSRRGYNMEDNKELFPSRKGKRIDLIKSSSRDSNKQSQPRC